MTPEEFRAAVAAYPAGDVLLTGHVDTIVDPMDEEPVTDFASITASRLGFERTIRFPDPLPILPVSVVDQMCRDAIESLTRNEEAFS